jgi:hypothetical protein
VTNPFRGAADNMPMGNVMQGGYLFLSQVHAWLVVVQPHLSAAQANIMFWCSLRPL